MTKTPAEINAIKVLMVAMINMTHKRLNEHHSTNVNDGIDKFQNTIKFLFNILKSQLLNYQDPDYKKTLRDLIQELTIVQDHAPIGQFELNKPVMVQIQSLLISNQEIHSLIENSTLSLVDFYEQCCQSLDNLTTQQYVPTAQSQQFKNLITTTTHSLKLQSPDSFNADGIQQQFQQLYETQKANSANVCDQFCGHDV